MKALLLEDDKDQADLVSATLLAIERAWDGLGRLVRLAPQGCEPQTVEYAPEDGAVASVSNGDAVATYLYDAARRDCGCAVALPNGAVMERLVSRDYYLDNPVISVRIVFAGETNRTLYVYDLAERPVARGTDSFAYSPRGEVVSAVVGGVAETHVYDGIGNSVSSTNGVEFASFGANQLNQYEWVSRSGGTPETHAYTPDGSLSSHGLWSFSYDALSRLVTASVSGVCVQSNAYDHIGRRVVKATPGAVHTFFYDGWTPVLELVERAGGATDRIEYHWGKDMSGTFGGAGGVGGLLYVKVNGDVYVPFCDGYGNVTEYRDSSGAVVASYSYGAFGQTVSQSGPMAGSFAFRYSTKYWDEETGLYYYGRRFYSPELMRWMTRDPIEEEGGANLYAFCENNAVCRFDKNGCAYIAYRRLDNPINKITGVVWSWKKERNNRVWAHQHIFFEDGKEPSNIGFFDDGIHEDSASNIKAKWIPSMVGLKDSCLRTAVSRVRPLKYSLLGDRENALEQYNCQDWIDEVLQMYEALLNGKQYIPKSTKYIGAPIQ